MRDLKMPSPSLGEPARRSIAGSFFHSLFKAVFTAFVLIVGACAAVVLVGTYTPLSWWLDKPAQPQHQLRQTTVGGNSIRMGMPDSAVQSVLGKPASKNRTVVRDSVHEQWVYEWWVKGKRNTKYLYFDNGVLTSWQETE